MGNYEYWNYKDLEIISTKKSKNNHLIYEHSDKSLYMVDSADNTTIIKSTDKGVNWDIIINQSYEIFGLYPDRSNNRLYYFYYNEIGIKVYSRYIDLSDDSDNADFDRSTYCNIGIDVLRISGTTYTSCIGHHSNNHYTTRAKLNATYSNNMGASAGRTSKQSKEIVIGSYTWFLWCWSNENVELWKWEVGTANFTEMEDCGVNTTLPNSVNQHGISYNGSDILYFILKDTSDSKNYLYTYIISTDTLTKHSESNVALMLDRNTDSTVNPPNNLEKAFHISEDRTYQIPLSYNGRLNLISKFNFADTIIVITDHFVMCAGGEMYEYVDLIDSIFNGFISHSRNDFPKLEMKYNSDDFQIYPQQFVQIIGPYTVDGSTTSNQVIFEGIAKKPTKGRIQYILAENQGSEMDQVQPYGSKAGRSDQIITDINNDGSPNGSEYIRDGTLSAGGAMGTLMLEGAKDYHEVVDDFAEHDGFLWSLRPQGQLDYNDGSIDSGADIRFDGSTYVDPILQMKAWTIAKLNRIIVNGGIDVANGIPFTGQWDDEEDQQENGINSVTVEDAQLNSDALCQSKADIMGGNESERTRAQFKFRKTTYGFIQPGQTITFKYDITNYITISEAQFIIDKMIIDIKSELGYMEISSGL